MEELVGLEGLEFCRSVRPADAVGPPWLLAAWDGADQAYLGKVYARWTCMQGVEVSLVACKVRVVPTKGLTTPRSELNGLLVMARLVNVIVEAMNEKPARIICLGDSECTISSFECQTATLAPYFSNRVAEVLDSFTRLRDQGIEVDPLYWLPGDQNPADQGTRANVMAADIGPESVHQRGPDWMKEPFEVWPTSREFLVKVPDEEMRKKYCGQFNEVSMKQEAGT